MHHTIRRLLVLTRHILQGMIIIFLLDGCFSPEPKTPLQNTYWSLIELDGQDSDNADHQPEVHLIFHINDQSLHGSDGCNRFQANYTHRNGHFKCEQIVSTRMHCAEGMDQAQKFLQALVKTDRIKVQENHLIFYAADVEIARFEEKEAF